MKKLETIFKEAQNVSVEKLESIVKCDEIDVSALKDTEKLSVLVFDEMRKALETKDYFLTLDCNYKQSKQGVKKVDYYRLVSKDTRNQSMIQFYFSVNYKTQRVYFRLATSCAKANREQFIALHDTLQFEIVMNHKTNKAKHSERRQVDYSEVVDVVKSCCAVLANKTDTIQ